MFAGKKSAQIREILISESAWEEMTCLFAPSLEKNLAEHINFVKEINEKIFSLLKDKLDGFNVLTHLMDQDEITIYILDGKLLINNFKSTPN